MPEKSHISVKVFGALAFKELLDETPNTMTKFVRSEMFRWTKRVRAKMVRERLKGRPGIKWRGPTGPSAKSVGGTAGRGAKKSLGKNIRGWVAGDGKFRDFEANVKISRFLNIHNLGTRTAGRGRRTVIPARLEFNSIFKSLEPDARIKMDKAMQRASDALTKRANRKGAKALGISSGAVFVGF